LSPIQHTRVMKAAQTGLTAVAEGVIVYWMDVMPTQILYGTATGELLEKWATNRLEAAIISCGVHEKIFAQTSQTTADGNKMSRRSGNKTLSKEFVGGNLNMTTLRSAAGMRSDSVRVVVADEVDGVPKLLTTGEGYFMKVLEGRMKAWNERKKFLAFSTPTTFERSVIYQEYLIGDQRKFHVPCPRCGAYQEIEWGNEGTTHGMKGEKKAGILDNVYYVCAHCREPIKQEEKRFLLQNGKWEPHSRAEKRYFRSYHIPGMLSPVGMLTWFEMYEDYINALDDPDAMRAFVNIGLGLPYKEQGERPKLENVISLRGGYKAGEVPYGVLFITMGVDVQQGSKRKGRKGARLEYEICGHGANFRTWQIKYGTIEGDIDNIGSGAWDELTEMINGEDLIFYRKEDGFQFRVDIIGIDSGDGNYMGTVYDYCRGVSGVYPVKGFKSIKQRTGEKGDEMTRDNLKRFRAARMSKHDVVLYEFATNHYKHHIYKNLKLTRNMTGDQKSGFCDFPADTPKEYFKMLTSEELREDGSFHAGSRRNEAMDCRVYNLGLCDVFLDHKVEMLRELAKKKGAKKAHMKFLNINKVLEMMTNATQGTRFSPEPDDDDPTETE